MSTPRKKSVCRPERPNRQGGLGGVDEELSRGPARRRRHRRFDQDLDEARNRRRLRAGSLRDTNSSPERSSTSVTSKLAERETLDEPSLEKVASDYRATGATSTDLKGRVGPFEPLGLVMEPSTASSPPRRWCVGIANSSLPTGRSRDQAEVGLCSHRRRVKEARRDRVGDERAQRVSTPSAEIDPTAIWADLGRVPTSTERNTTRPRSRNNLVGEDVKQCARKVPRNHRLHEELDEVFWGSEDLGKLSGG
jgi:hypothetical protein